MWTLTIASDIIGTTVGGNRYGWFPTDEFPFLAFDTSPLLGFQDFSEAPPSTPGAKVTAGGWIAVTGGKGTFGLTAKANASGDPSRNFTYQDHAQKRVDAGSVSADGRATFSGTASFDFGDGTPPLPAVTFRVTPAPDGVVLAIDSTTLPATALTAGAITIE